MAAAPGSSGLHEVLSQVAEELRCECGPRTQSTVKERQPCQTKQLILAFFADEPAAETAALALKDSGVAESDAIGILVLDATGSVVVDKVGATSVAAGAGVGAALLVLGPFLLGVGVAVVGGGIGMAGGALGGSLHHKGLKLV